MRLCALALILAPASVSAGTGRLVSSWMSRAPAIDGTLDPEEWAQSTVVDVGAGAFLRIGNDGRTLYFAAHDTSYPFTHVLDQLVLFFDDEGGAAPQLDDGLWTNTACHSDPQLGEGESWFLHASQQVQFYEWVDPGGAPNFCPAQAITSRLSFASTAGLNGTDYELAIPLDGVGPLNAQPGSRVAISVRLVDSSGGPAKCYPSCDIAPSSFRNLILASGGCNTGPRGLEGGLPLDWESAIVEGSGTGWQASLTEHEPELCLGNSTGGAGLSACVATAGYTSASARSLLSVPVAFDGSSNVTIRFRGSLIQGKAGVDLLGLEAGLEDSSFDEILVWQENHLADVGQAELDLEAAPYAGNLPTELFFDHYTEAGIEQDGYAQVDDLELLCAPVLFSDGFETRLTTHWSATVP